ncbi:MAG TPA: thiamine phosphate synthase [Dehalococcoidia bacterium]|jgi:thiamine-phosphate pyrophosphorylase|nr:thiamine phosphate synthase [Dehalococcoidia bacterium]
MREKLRGLYVIIDPAVAGERDVAWIAAEAIAGGARLIQWRDKLREKGLQLPDLDAIARVCRENGVPLIVNDDVDVALVAGADGVHIGQKDLPVAAVRKIVPREWIVGASTNNVAEARQAAADGADYVSVGNLFGTTSKEDTRPATLEMLHAVCAAVSVPVCGIGGINESNIRSVVDTGAAMACVISAVVAAEDPREAARRLSAAF